MNMDKVFNPTVRVSYDPGYVPVNSINYIAQPVREPAPELDYVSTSINAIHFNPRAVTKATNISIGDDVNGAQSCMPRYSEQITFGPIGGSPYPWGGGQSDKSAPLDWFNEETKRKMKEALDKGDAASVGMKFDAGKPECSLIPPEVLFELGKVLGYGAKKYAARNWELGISYDRVFSSLQRHLWAWWDPNQSDTDPETGLSHLSHALCNIAFLLHFEQTGRTELDTRPKKNG